METPGQILRRTRLAAGIRQKALTEILGISSPFLCVIELGKRPLPWKHIIKLPDGIREEVQLAAERVALQEIRHGKTPIE